MAYVLATLLSVCFLLPRSALAQQSPAFMVICNGGQYIETGTKMKPERVFVSVVITFSADQESEVLIGARRNKTIGQRDPIYFDGLVFEKGPIAIGFMKDDPEGSAFWTFYKNEERALVSLKDITVMAENCVEFPGLGGSGSPKKEPADPASPS